VREYYQSEGVLPKNRPEGITFILNGNMKRRKCYVAEQTNVNVTYSVT
jgi:hypothetical protein